MGERLPQTPLERVAHLERENAALAARIARLRARDAMAQTVSTRRRAKPALGMALGFALCGAVSGLTLGIAVHRATAVTAVANEPPPAIDPLPPTPPVYAVPPPRVAGMRMVTR